MPFAGALPSILRRSPRRAGKRPEKNPALSLRTCWKIPGQDEPGTVLINPFPSVRPRVRPAIEAGIMPFPEAANPYRTPVLSHPEQLLGLDMDHLALDLQHAVFRLQDECARHHIVAA